jgi:carboxypeptidase PM20D1
LNKGTLDNKQNLLSIMESVEILLSQKYQPKRTFYFSFTSDEEIGGNNGAKLVTELLSSRNITFEVSHDEGGFISYGQFPSINSPIGLIATCEKGFVTLELQLDCEPGHSSMPPYESCIGKLSKNIIKLENNQMSDHLTHGNL